MHTSSQALFLVASKYWSLFQGGLEFVWTSGVFAGEGCFKLMIKPRVLGRLHCLQQAGLSSVTAPTTVAHLEKVSEAVVRRARHGVPVNMGHGASLATGRLVPWCRFHAWCRFHPWGQFERSPGAPLQYLLLGHARSLFSFCQYSLLPLCMYVHAGY